MYHSIFTVDSNKNSIRTWEKFYACKEIDSNCKLNCFATILNNESEPKSF